MSDARPLVDAHLHIWQLSSGEYTWNTADLGALHRDVTGDEISAVLVSAQVDRAVLVQAADTAGDTDRMLRFAETEPRVAGVVAWVPLTDPIEARRRFDALDGRPVVGVRQLLHDHPDPTLLDDERVRATCRELIRRGLPLDVPDAWPSLWPAVVRLARDLPDLVIVLDHLGKPRFRERRRADDIARWTEALHGLAGSPNVVGKLSGLGEFAHEGTTVALAAFGPRRLMWGSDWPVSTGSGSYADLLEDGMNTLRGLSSGDREDVLANTAQRVYRLRPSA